MDHAPSSPTDTATRPAGVPNLVVPHAVLPFYLADAPVRGRLIRLGPLADSLLSRHSTLPQPVLALGGQALALVAAMATALKFTGSFSLQIKGDGPISLFLVDCTDSGALRFTACMSKTAPTTLPSTTSALLGSGYLAFTVDQGPDTERHQGIVSLEGETLTDMATHYFDTSEQHDCTIHLYARQENSQWQAGALILERIASESIHADNDDHPIQNSDDLWETACTLAATLKEDELFDPALSGSTLIHRLFGTLGVVAGTARPLSFGCRCHKERLLTILEQFNIDDLDHMTQNGVISMDCGFCNTQFHIPRHQIQKEHPGSNV